MHHITDFAKPSLCRNRKWSTELHRFQVFFSTVQIWKNDPICFQLLFPFLHFSHSDCAISIYMQIINNTFFSNLNQWGIIFRFLLNRIRLLEISDRISDQWSNKWSNSNLPQFDRLPNLITHDIRFTNTYTFTYTYSITYSSENGEHFYLSLFLDINFAPI